MLILVYIKSLKIEKPIYKSLQVKMRQEKSYALSFNKYHTKETTFIILLLYFSFRSKITSFQGRIFCGFGERGGIVLSSEEAFHDEGVKAGISGKNKEGRKIIKK